MTHQYKKILINTFLVLLLLLIVITVKIIKNTPFINTILSKISYKPYCKDCNVILISLDTLGADHLPCYGYSRNTAPNLCRFANDNIMFKNMYANSSWTLPSHVSIFTGLLPSQHHVNEPNKDSLSASVPFLPSILKDNGYDTYFYMRVGNSLPPNLVYNRGIDIIKDVDHPEAWKDGLNHLKQNSFNSQKTFLFLHTYWVHAPYFLEDTNRKIFTENDPEFPNIPTTNKELYACTEATMQHVEKALKHDLDIGYWDAVKNQIYTDLYNKLINNPTNKKSLCDNGSYFEYIQNYLGNSFQSKVDTSDKRQIYHLVNSYDSKIKELDEYMQSVFDFVLNSKLKNNTIIIVTADHGEEFMEHGELGHGNNLYNTTIRVPLFMYIPGQHGKVISRPTQSIDILPTLLGLLQISTKYHFFGSDIFKTNEMSKKDRSIISEQLSFNDSYFSATTHQWKLLYKKYEAKVIPYELYDIVRDSGEKFNKIFKLNGIADMLLNIK